MEDDTKTITPAGGEIPPAARDVSGGMGSTRAWFAFSQALAAFGGIIAFMGLGESTWVVKLYQFLRSNEAVPVVGFVIWVGGGIALWWRAKGRQEALAFFSALMPDRISRTKGELKPSVQLAVNQVTVAGLVPVPQAPVLELNDKEKPIA